MNPEIRTPGGHRANEGACAGTARLHSTARRRLAPYARQILDLQRRGIDPNVYLFAGSAAWNQAEYRRRTHGEGSVLVLPPGEHPDRFRWPRLDALVALPGDCPGHRFRALVRALLVAGGRCVIEIRPGTAPVAHYADERDTLGAAWRT